MIQRVVAYARILTASDSTIKASQSGKRCVKMIRN